MPKDRPYAATAAAARAYRSLGYNPIPSRSDVKGPALKDYVRYRDGEPVPASWVEDAHWWAANLQIACGTPWRLAVIDVDGPVAGITWRRWARRMACPRTWTVRTGGGGLHLYWSLPRRLPKCRSRRVWGLWDETANGWYRHNFIELLADKRLAIAPPSRHVVTGEPYRWIVGPEDMPRPSLIPDCILDLPEVLAPAVPTAPAAARPRRAAPRHPRRPSRRHEWADVLARLSPERKLELAVGWGLRLAAAHLNAKGGVSCHAIDRKDHHPSATFFPATGVYCEPFVRSVGFFRLAVELGAYESWQDCCNDLGETH